MTARFEFELLATDTASKARRGRFHTPHGAVDTPAFMPVGTLASVKGLTPDQIAATGAQMVLSNTYHLALRPGAQVVEQLGGLHAFMQWSGPILTDSGGFQVFSLARLTKVTDEGAVVRSHIDGSVVELTPERVVELQEALGSDVAMVLDHVLALPGAREALADAMERTLRWADRSRAVARRADQALFGIVQGGLEPDLRLRCAERLCAMDFPGYAVGGLGVGETAAEMYDALDHTVPALPTNRPRYLMGVGTPSNLLEAIARGIDLFDCVMPTRNGRNAMAFTGEGPLRLRNERFRTDHRPLEEDCPCAACRHSRGYLRHLFMASEMLGPILLSIHNLTFYQRLLSEARAAILAGTYETFRSQRQERWAGAGTSTL